jgi:sugar phosphate isomerase/epimerase
MPVRGPRQRVSRREFLRSSGSGVAFAVAAPLLGDEQQQAAQRFPIIGFTKPFQSLPARQIAETVAAIGWQGIECPIRAKGQIEPARVADDLPELIEALKSVNCEISLVATDITNITQPHAETVLKTLSQAGIKRLRLGFWHYRADQSPAVRLDEIAPAVRDLAAACKDLGLKAGIQNHSGATFVGAPVWDIYTLVRDLDPSSIGICFDIGHATLEGGLSWPIEAKLMEPFYTAVMVKDFVWAKGAMGWKEQGCPLGEGMVNREFFRRLKASGYEGPICQHHEYELGEHSQMVAQMKRDLDVLKRWLE